MGLILKIVLALLALLFALLLLVLAWGLLFGLPGRAPDRLGVQPDGRLSPCPATPNCVSSYATSGYHAIAALPPAGAGMADLVRVLGSMPGVRIEEQREGYLRATQRTRWLGFVDDIEFLVDGGLLQVRSASRLGRKDFGVNRARVERIRAALAGGS